MPYCNQKTAGFFEKIFAAGLILFTVFNRLFMSKLCAYDAYGRRIPEGCRRFILKALTAVSVAVFTAA